MSNNNIKPTSEKSFDEVYNSMSDIKRLLWYTCRDMSIAKAKYKFQGAFEYFYTRRQQYIQSANNTQHNLMDVYNSLTHKESQAMNYIVHRETINILKESASWTHLNDNSKNMLRLYSKNLLQKYD